MKYTVITGASSGIGYEAALAFAKEGKNLILAARREVELEKVRDAVQEINSDLRVIVKVVDLSISENVYAFYESLKEYDTTLQEIHPHDEIEHSSEKASTRDS